MSYLSSLPKNLGELSVKFLSAKNGNDTRQRLGDLLCSIADCVSSIAVNIRNGQHSPSQCAELATYIANLHSLIEREINKAIADQLTLWLTYVDAVPGIARINIERDLQTETKPAWTPSHRFAQYESIEEIAGTIRAMGHLIRV